MKSASSLSGVGSSARSLDGVSVVPKMTLPSQGTANKTLPSDVLGTISATSDCRNSASTTKCTPWLGATMGLTGALRPAGLAAPSLSRKASTQTPVALITQRDSIE